MNANYWLVAATAALSGLGAAFIPGVADPIGRSELEAEVAQVDGEAVSALSEPKLAPCNTCMVFERGENRNDRDNPIQTLRLYQAGRLYAEFPAVSGRAESQGRNRHQGGTEAPLPDGIYSVATSAIAGTHPEVGGRFLPVTPQFTTGRTYLGLHWDPSYEKDNGEDGTSGCIALTNAEDFDRVLRWVERVQPDSLIVQLQ